MASAELIDAARSLGYTDAEVARRIGVSRSYLCDVAAGRKSLSPEAAALLADLAGRDPTEALKAQTVENEKDADRRERLRRALFVCWVAGVAAALQIATATPVEAAMVALDRIHIVARRFMRLIAAAGTCNEPATARH